MESQEDLLKDGLLKERMVLVKMPSNILRYECLHTIVMGEGLVSLKVLKERFYNLIQMSFLILKKSNLGIYQQVTRLSHMAWYDISQDLDTGRSVVLRGCQLPCFIIWVYSSWTKGMKKYSQCVNGETTTGDFWARCSLGYLLCEVFRGCVIVVIGMCVSVCSFLLTLLTGQVPCLALFF